MTGAHEIRVMTIEDVKPVAGSLARAFADDPLQVWAIPDEERRVPLLEDCFAVLLEHLDLAYGLSYCDEHASTAAVWLPPVLRKPSAVAIEALATLDSRLGHAGPRLHAAQDAMDAVRPATPHYYLQGLGTDPPFQGHGLGSAAMQPVLARCDKEHAPAYLESTKERNLPFYERHGFKVTGTIDVKPDGPRLWTMWRNPMRR
jgi:GNAT superfamily N-acetyltransferase